MLCCKKNLSQSFSPIQIIFPVSEKIFAKIMLKIDVRQHDFTYENPKCFITLFDMRKAYA